MKQQKTKNKEKYVDLITVIVKDQSKLDLNTPLFNRLDKNSLISSLVKTSGPDQIVWIDYVLNSYPFDVTKKLFINESARYIFQSFFDTHSKEFNKEQFHESIKELMN